MPGRILLFFERSIVQSRYLHRVFSEATLNGIPRCGSFSENTATARLVTNSSRLHCILYSLVYGTHKGLLKYIVFTGYLLTLPTCNGQV
jgi:hypothetical protein